MSSLFIPYESKVMSCDLPCPYHTAGLLQDLHFRGGVATSLFNFASPSEFGLDGVSQEGNSRVLHSKRSLFASGCVSKQARNRQPLIWQIWVNSSQVFLMLKMKKKVGSGRDMLVMIITIHYSSLYCYCYCYYYSSPALPLVIPCPNLKNEMWGFPPY